MSCEHSSLKGETLTPTWRVSEQKVKPAIKCPNCGEDTNYAILAQDMICQDCGEKVQDDWRLSAYCKPCELEVKRLREKFEFEEKKAA